jgi:predicted methyltransferase
MREHVRHGDVCIDATAGRGRDTAFLCECVGASGKVLSFDIQQEAFASTHKLLAEKGLLNRAELILESHSEIARFAQPESVSCISFNFSWLPGGDHSVFTRAATSIPAIEAGLSLLKLGGVMSLCIYYGRDCGFEERDAILAYLQTVDSLRFTVIVSAFTNRPNNPPIWAFIMRDE